MVLSITNSSPAVAQSNAALAAFMMVQQLELFSNPTPQQTDVWLLKSVDGFDVYKVVLDYPMAGKINMLLKGPKNFLFNKSHQFHSIMIVSGFFTGEQSIHLIGNFPDKVLVGFEYPYSAGDFQRDPGTILEFVQKTPVQMALATKWLSAQNWSEPKGVSIMGVSLGGVFLPSSLHLSQRLGIEVEKAIYVCTGAEIPSILRENLRKHVSEPALSPLVDALTIPTLLIDPKLHFPFLKGTSLVIQTDHDTVIPDSSKNSLINALPYPKTQVVLQGPHINSDQKELIQKVQTIVAESYK